MTVTENRIEELAQVVNNANTATVEGRQAVADACKALYNLIEKDVYEADKEYMLKGMYTDLTSGNFAEPFYCEQKKHTFEVIVAIYNDRIVPFI